MQKLLRRVATAERVAAKRKTKLQARQWKADRKEEARQNKVQLSTAIQDINRGRRAIRDDWELGPLSPNIDVGQHANKHGAIVDMRFSSSMALSIDDRNARSRWAGGIYHLNLAVGDRVVLLDGPDRGKIGPISKLDKGSATVTIDGLNKSNISLPDGLEKEELGEHQVLNLELPIPISAVRLVHPIKDPETGITKDVIINQLVKGPVYKNRWARIVPGLNISIPWPKVAKAEYKEAKCDTMRIDVEDKTFVPTLLRPPMPAGLIDELRGKYSRFRTRHDSEYVAKTEAKDQSLEDRKLLIETMRTPLGELHKAERDRKKKKGKPRLTLEMMEKIGEVIAKNKGMGLASPGGIPSSGVTGTTPAAAPGEVPTEVLSSSSQPTQAPPPS